MQISALRNVNVNPLIGGTAQMEGKHAWRASKGTVFVTVADPLVRPRVCGLEAATSNADPRQQQYWMLKRLQGGRAHPLAACGWRRSASALHRYSRLRVCVSLCCFSEAHVRLEAAHQ